MSKCNKCKRELPNKSFRTKKGCKWCDWTYHRSQKEEERIPAIIKILIHDLKGDKNGRKYS